MFDFYRSCEDLAGSEGMLSGHTHAATLHFRGNEVYGSFVGLELNPESHNCFKITVAMYVS